MLAFFAELPVAEWLNLAAPRVKSGEIVPDSLDVEQALAMLLAEPLLIRRPLIQVGDRREVGFDIAKIHAWLGLPESVGQLTSRIEHSVCRLHNIGSSTRA